MMLCVCRVCALRFDRRPGVSGSQFWASLCPCCDGIACPNCKSHDIYDIVGEVVHVPQAQAASIRASVWGRGQ